MKNDSSFNYTYSAIEQEEIKNIRQKYIAPTETENKMEKLRKLDASVNSKATVISLIVGVIGALIFGTGMSLIMSDIGKLLTLGAFTAFVIGVILGVVGLIFICVAYPIYNFTLKKERAKIASEIIRLSDELLK